MSADRGRVAIGEADRVLQALWRAIYSHATGSGAQRIDGSELYLLAEINKARSAIAGSMSGENQPEVGPHAFVPFRRWWNRGRCRHCFVPKVDHPVRGWIEGRALGDKRLPDYGGSWTDHVSTPGLSGTGWMP